MSSLYRVNADNLFPYNLYAGQQDNSTVKIQSRTFGPGIGQKNWYPVGGGESAHAAFDPDEPILIYAGSYQGQITEFDDKSRMTRDIRRYPLGAAYRPPTEYPYRFNWNAPIVVSQHDPSVIYHGAQMLLKSTASSLRRSTPQRRSGRFRQLRPSFPINGGLTYCLEAGRFASSF